MQLQCITLGEFFHTIYDSYLRTEKDAIYLLHSTDDSSPIVATDIGDIFYSYLGSPNPNHFIPAIFCDWSDSKFKARTKKSLRRIVVMPFDFEATKPDGSPYTQEEACQLFEERTGAKPFAITPSKTPGHYHIWLRHKDVTGHENSIKFWELIQKTISELIGADMVGCGAVHPFRLPSPLRGIYKYSDEVYDLDVFRHLLPPRGVPRQNRGQAKDDVVANDGEYFTAERAMRSEAIQALLNATFPTESSRQQAAFTLALFFKAIGKPKVETEHYMLNEWYDKARKLKASSPFHLSEVVKAVKSAYSGKYRGPKREYIEQITGIEFPFNLHQRRRERQDREGQEVVASKTPEENREIIIGYFREQGGEVLLNRHELFRELEKRGMAEGTARRYLAKLKKDGTLIYESERGKSARPTLYKLVDGVRGKKKATKTKKQAQKVAKTMVEADAVGWSGEISNQNLDERDHCIHQYRGVVGPESG